MVGKMAYVGYLLVLDRGNLFLFVFKFVVFYSMCSVFPPRRVKQKLICDSSIIGQNAETICNFMLFVLLYRALPNGALCGIGDARGTEKKNARDLILTMNRGANSDRIAL